VAFTLYKLQRHARGCSPTLFRHFDRLACCGWSRIGSQAEGRGRNLLDQHPRRQKKGVGIALGAQDRCRGHREGAHRKVTRILKFAATLFPANSAGRPKKRRRRPAQQRRESIVSRLSMLPLKMLRECCQLSTGLEHLASAVASSRSISSQLISRGLIFL
jgi:hypothetical protein